MVEKDIKREIMFGIIIFLLIILSIKGLITVVEYIGYASLESEGGTITEIGLEAKFDIDKWTALFGTAWNVGWTQEWVFNLTGNHTLDNTNEKHLLFECFENEKEHEIYASMVPENEIIFGSLVAASTADYDTYLNLPSSSFYSASNTFPALDTFQVGANNIVAPATYTFTLGTVNSTTFVTGMLKDDIGNLVLVTKVLSIPTDSFRGDRLNYQILLPLDDSLSQEYYFWTDPTDECPGGGTTPLPWTGCVFGNVTDTSGNPIGEAVVEVAGNVDMSDDVTGYYEINATEGNFSIYAMKTAYRVYRGNVTITRDNCTEHNIVLVMDNPPNPPNPGVGPGIDEPGKGSGPGVDPEGNSFKDGEYDMPPATQRPKKIEGTDYIVSVSEINRKIRLGNFLQEKITLYSFKESTANIYFSLDGNISQLIKLDKESLLLPPRSADFVTVTIFGVGEIGTYTGNLTLSGDFNVSIPVTIEVLPKDKLPIEALMIDLELSSKVTYPGNNFKFKTDLKNLLTDQQYPVQLFYSIQDTEGENTLWTYDTNVYLRTSFSLLKNSVIPKNARTGDYVLRVTANYLGLTSSTSSLFKISTPWYLATVIGSVRMWHLLLFLLLLALALLAYWQIRRRIEAKKKFHLKVEMSEIPKPGPRSIWVGKIAETDHKTYFNIESFMTHCIDAGSTGSGKSVSAQVIVEEMLQKGVAVIVFDPTAQWTGMLRKCTDKIMLSLYPFFGMKPTDAKAFNGNIRQITNPKEIIDIKKYVKPGEIQIFACHKLEPKDMDIFVANSIRQIFRSNFGESRTLKILFVYDEVHRLLPKFGGSGEGFLQIERGCREFRKWGLGMLLISQVLTDFVGTIKANINTEVQMRTRDEGDLGRIKEKYGDDVLKSLVKATIGSGMVENPQYNRGKPYFVAFRPLQHSVQRLTDEEIEKYNEYNEKIDQMQFELEELEKEGLDIFDLKLELKLATDKVKTGSFNMVQIYLEGLVPRIKKLWEKIGKTPKKLEKQVISEADLQADLKKAKESREAYEAEQKKNSPSAAEGEKKEVDLFKKDVDPDKLLKLVNGMLVINMASLYDEIVAMKDDDYAKHVNEEKNDFAKWIEDAVGDKDLADRVSLAQDKKAVLELLDLRRAKKPLPKLDSEQAKKLKESRIISELSKPPENISASAKPNAAKTEQAEAALASPKAIPPSAPMQASATATPATAAKATPAITPAVAPKATAEPKPAVQPPAPEETKENYFEKDVEPEQILSLDNGMIVMNMSSLYDEINGMNPDEFAHYVNADQNQFATWIRDAIGDKTLAEKLANTKNKDDVLKLLIKRKNHQRLEA